MSSRKNKNVKVVVRVRPLNGNEILQKARNAVSIDRDGKTVFLKEKLTMRPFGPFDKAYGEDTSQASIYKDVVAPLIGQVLNGFNCTVFAYGQTGSGKTFTMEGHHDEDGNFSWETDPKAGIIPRALHHIFSTLEAQQPEDYSVRASYVELYNEQLFDLLGVEGQALRVYDNKENGIVINGMEEVPVRNRSEVYTILKRGADRRKTASTLMNINSSRSHSVFTLTVTTRQTIDDEELLRVGKIHMVDLAGSENVGKSGAIDARAREAGNINTSLLALGRVITALTSNAAHVPYRESKLTRILQDSLGGKTITTIIATLSPASTNFEESASTLEYGQRAKNIKNSPEANQCLSRKRIMMAYGDEIARLQRDLASARAGSGFYVDKENYERMESENAESREKIEGLEAELAEQLTKLANVTDDLNFMDNQYEQAYVSLMERTARYEKKVREQERLRKELSDTTNNYHSALDALQVFQGVAEKLRSREIKQHETAVMLFDELGSTHAKVERLRSMQERNDHVLGNFAAHTISRTSEVKSNVLDKARVRSQSTVKELESKLNVFNNAISDSIKLTLNDNKTLSALINQTGQAWELIEQSLGSEVKQFASDVIQRLSAFFADLSEKSEGIEANAQCTLERLDQFNGLLSAYKDRFEIELAEARGEAEREEAEVTAVVDSMAELVEHIRQKNRDIKQRRMERSTSVKKPVDDLVAAGKFVCDAGQMVKKVAELQASIEQSVLRAQPAISECVSRIEADTNDKLENIGQVRHDMAKSADDLCGMIDKRATESNDLATDAVESVYTLMEKENEYVQESWDQLTAFLADSQTQLEHVLHQELERESHSGSTPPRRPAPAQLGATFSPLPSKEQLLKEMARTPQRASIFRVRDTLLESELPVQSPNTLKRRLPSVVRLAEQEDD